MSTISDSAALAGLVGRLRSIGPQAERRWGTLTPGEMFCHLGDTCESVLGHRVPPGPQPSGKPRPVLKWLMLYSPLPWPKGAKTRPGVDPRQQGTRPGEFENDRERAASRLTELAVAPAERLSKVHFIMGPMSRKDWQRWAYRHFDHHLRQFGV